MRVAAFLLIFAACAPLKALPPRLWDWGSGDIPMTVIVHEDIAPAVIAEVEAAMAWWEEAADEDLFVDLGDVAAGAIVIIMPASVKFPEHYDGMAHKAGSTVGIYIRVTSKYLGRVIRHELGHAMGLPHNESTRLSVMYPQVFPGEYEATEDDLSLLP